MRIWVGDETGLLKGVQVESKKVDTKLLQQDRSKEIQRMCWGPDEKTILLGFKNRTVQSVSVGSQTVVQTFDNFNADFVGLECVENTLAACTSKGTLQMFDLGSDVTDAKYTQEYGDDLFRMRLCHENANMYAIGGKGQGRDLKIFDISSKEPVFKAKNVSNDMVDLQVPIWIHDLAFVPGSQGSKIVTVTAHRHIRLYDTKMKKKPIFSEEFGEHPIMSVAVSNDGLYAVFGNSIGEMRKVDLRTGKLAGGFKGHAGSIRSIMCHESLPIVASCGLDRHSFVHDMNGAQMLKMYMKQRQNAILISKEGPTQTNTGTKQSRKEEDKNDDTSGDDHSNDQQSEGEEEEEDVWEAMEEVKESSSSKRKKTEHKEATNTHQKKKGKR